VYFYALNAANSYIFSYVERAIVIQQPKGKSYPPFFLTVSNLLTPFWVSLIEKNKHESFMDLVQAKPQTIVFNNQKLR
jgi:hypothetical protein